MRRIGFAVLLLLALAAASPAIGQSWHPPTTGERCPSKWGAADERGSANHMRPSNVLRAMRLVKSGDVIELGHVLRSDMPLYGSRRFEVRRKRSVPVPAANGGSSNEEMVIAELGHVGTHIDGFAHHTIGADLYNCVKQSEVATPSGFTKLGIENAGALITRGVLIDVAALKGVATLPPSYEITVADLEQALRRERLALRPGDAVIINTGWGTLWDKDNARFERSCPGIGVKAAEWLAAQDPMLVGSDNWPVEVFPNPDPQLIMPVHQIMLAANGIHLVENMKLDELAAKRAYEFALVVEPLKIAGATGSTVAPIAIR
jgi:kynurenine formamidase